MSPFSDDPDFLDLMAAWHENRELSGERTQELLSRLEADPELRRELAREVQLAALTGTVQKGESSWLRLEEKLATGEAPDTDLPREDAIMSRVRRAAERNLRIAPARSWILGMAAAAAVLVLGVSILLHGRMTSRNPDEASVARVIRMDGEARTNQGRTLGAGGMLRAGEKLTMTQGLVEMAFLDTGVHVVATAPLALTADSRERLFVHDGEVKLHVPPQGIGFVVETLERKITDLGTSFVVTARKTGSKVLVLDGQIAVADREGSPENLMVEGELADFDRSGEMLRHSSRPSGVPELTLPSMEPTVASLPGRVIAFTSIASSPGRDVLGQRLLPLVRSGFQDESCLAGLKLTGPLRFAGIAGTYNRFPKVTGLEPYENSHGWLAWYGGQVNPPHPGRYRFWGYADNHLLVAVDGKPVFEGSRYGSALREELGVPRHNHPSLPCLNAVAGFASGEWFEVGGGPVRFDLLFGEESQNLTSGLLLVEREGETYGESFWGQPKWPLFLTEPPTPTQLSELEKLRLHMEERLMGSFSVSREAFWPVVANP